MRNFKIELKWGLIFIVVSLIWMGMENVAGLHTVHIDRHAYYTNLFAIPAILVYVLALRDKRNNFYNGSMTWKQGFIAGLIITVIVALFSPLTQLITHKIIAPSYFANAIEHGVAIGRDREALEGYFNLKSYIMQSIFGALSMGIVTAAVVALFVKKKEG